MFLTSTVCIPLLWQAVGGEVLPYGEPIYYEGKYKEDPVYPLYIQSISCAFEIKENMIPTIQLKNKSYFFAENEYLESSNGEIVNMTLTNIDLELFLEHYNTYDLMYHDGWKFKGCTHIFKKYIEKWTNKKIEAGKAGNKRSKAIE